MKPKKLTARQMEVLSLRYDRGASIGQIATWLRISRRAVFYRLRNARRRASQSPESIVLQQKPTLPGRRARLYNLSQMSIAAANGALNIDEL